MPGAQPNVSRYGVRTEALAQTILSCLAFTVPVPRQDDLGADFSCTLAHPNKEKQLYLAGASFIVQAKSNRKTVAFEKQHATTWFLTQKIPYFLGVVTRSKLKLDLYSTWRRTDALMSWGHTQEIILKPDACGEVTTEGPEDAAIKTIYLGRPVVSVTLRKLVSPRGGPMLVEHLLNVLSAWIQIDQMNIYNAWADIHFTAGPPTHETNVIPSPERRLLPYTNEKNIPKTLAQLRNSAEFLRLEYNKAHPQEADPEPLTRLQAVLEDVRRLVEQAAKPAP